MSIPSLLSQGFLQKRPIHSGSTSIEPGAATDNYSKEGNVSKWLASLLVLLASNSVIVHALARPTQHSNTPRVRSADAQAQPSTLPKVDGTGGP